MSLDMKNEVIPLLSCINQSVFLSLMKVLERVFWRGANYTQNMLNLADRFNKYREGGIHFFPEMPLEPHGLYMYNPDKNCQWKLTIHEPLVNVNEYSLYMLVREITYYNSKKYMSMFFCPYGDRDLEESKVLFRSGILFTRNSISDIIADFILSTSQGKRMRANLIKIIVSYITCD